VSRLIKELLRFEEHELELRVERTSPPGPHRSAQTGTTTTYKELADRLELEPPQTIHRLGEALEALMKDDVTAIGRCWPHFA